MKGPSHYDVLRVSRGADEGDIRRAFRHLAFQYHPDRVGGGAEACEGFRRLREAYEVLSDPLRRAAYDAELVNRTGVCKFGFVGGGGRGVVGAERRRVVDYEAAPVREGARPAPSYLDLHVELGVSLEESVAGTCCAVKVEDAAHLTRRVRVCHVHLPEGLWEGSQWLVAGLGRCDPFSGRCGHLYVKVVLQEHEAWRVEGLDVHGEVGVEHEAWREGVTLEVRTLDGWVPLSLPGNVGRGACFRLPGRGLFGPDGRRGDLHVRVRPGGISGLGVRRLWGVACSSRRAS